MSFFAVLFALILEQARPLSRGNWVHAAFLGWTRWAHRSLDAGKPHHGWITWLFAVVVPTLVTLLVHWLLWRVNVLLAFAWSVAVLYVTLGFRQFSHYFTDIRNALDDGNEDAARELLAKWRQVDASELPRSEIVRHVIEYSVLAAHRHVFGVFAWFSVFAALGLGPAGAVLYRMSEFAARYWTYKSKKPGEGASPALQRVATSAWGVIDYVPARVTSLGFAVVGSFEDAIRLAANHDGDSDSTASIAGQLYGTRHGIMAVPHAWVRRLDVLQDALQVTQRFLDTQKMQSTLEHNVTTHQQGK